MLIFDLIERFVALHCASLVGPRRALLNGSGGKGAFKYTYGYDLTQGSIPVGFSFSRASGTTQSDMDSCVNQLAANEACFPKLRRVQNLVSPSQSFNGGAPWTPGVGGTAVTPNAGVAPDGSNTATLFAPTIQYGGEQYTFSGLTIGAVYVFSIYFKVISGNVALSTTYLDNGFSNVITPLVGTSSWQRVSVIHTAQATVCTWTPIQDRNVSGFGSWLMWGAQGENVTGQLNQSPGPYVSTGVLSYPYHGTGVDGSQYFTTRNGNVVQQNLIPHSSDTFGSLGTGWAPINLTATGGQADPFGGNTAGLFPFATGASYVGVSVGGNGIGTLTLYAKYVSGAPSITLGTSGASVPGNTGATFNVATGSVSGTYGTTANIYSSSCVAVPGYPGWYRLSISILITNGVGSFSLGGIGSAGTMYLAGPQSQPGEVASTYVPTTSAAVNNNIVESYAGTPIDLTNPAIGLRAWGARTNSIRNNTMVGGGAGTLPTNWTGFANQNGVVVSVVGTGTENGVPYTEFSFSGTPSSTFTLQLFFDSTTQVAASAGQFWTASQFVKLSAGATTNASFGQSIAAYASGTFVNQSNPAIAIPTSAGLGSQRSQQTWTAPATTTSLISLLAVGFTSGQAITFNMRIGAPQLEQVVASTDVASDVIFTTNAAVTCSQDLCSATPTINASQGTLQVEFTVNQTPNSGLNAGAAAELSNGTATNRVLAFLVSGTANSYVTAAGVQQTGISLGTITVGTVHRQAISYGIPNSDSCIDAGSIFAGTGGTAPTGMNTLTLGSQQDTTAPLFGVVRKVHLSKTAANDATLKTITSASA